MRRFAGKATVLAAALVWNLLPGGGIAGQEPLSPAGHWEGVIVAAPGAELGIDVDLKLTDGTWSGDISIPVQATQDFPLSDIVVAGTEISFKMAGVPGEPTFRGRLSEDGKTLSGSFVQGTANLQFRLTRSEGQ